MTAKLSDELQRAADAQADRPVAAEHEATKRVYYIYTEKMHEKASRALQEQEDNNAIAEGLKQLENGEGRSLHEVDADMRKDFGLPPRQ